MVTDAPSEPLVVRSPFEPQKADRMADLSQTTKPMEVLGALDNAGCDRVKGPIASLRARYLAACRLDHMSAYRIARDGSSRLDRNSVGWGKGVSLRGDLG